MEPIVPAEHAEELYELAPCGYLSTMPDGTIIKVNQTLLSWTGFEREALLGRRFADLLTAGGRIFHETHYAPLLSMQGHVREIAVDVVCADGRQLPVLLNSILVRDPDGAPRVIRTSVFDATDRREYERELLRARRRAERSEARAKKLAATLQSSLIPPALPHMPGLEVGAAYRPAGKGDEVGGDFYDVFETGDGDWSVVLGDVRGKGAAAANVTALARHTVRAAAMRTRTPSEVLTTLNAALLQSATDRFCTVVYVRVRRDDHDRAVATIASGGHPLPIGITATGTAPIGRPGTLLGVLDDPELHDVSVPLAPGEALFCYTDGVVEGRRGRELYGERRLSAALARFRDLPRPDVARAVVEDVVAFQSGTPRDDIAVVLVGVPLRTGAGGSAAA